ncbi:MAG: hypothetical protein ACXWRZ_05435 [Bdellovibrio sp.]
MNRAERRKFERELAKTKSKQSKIDKIVTSKSKADLKAVFQEYSFEDIWRYIFICDLWLPNIAAYAKHQFLLCLLLSCPLSTFEAESKIKSYEDFCLIFKKISSLLPSFPMIEDYSPEADWGQIKHFFDGEIYSILYGCELSALSDYFSSFELIYSPFDLQYIEATGRSPVQELKTVLGTHNHLIENIHAQPIVQAIGEIIPGSIKLPSIEFWSEVRDYIENGLFLSLVDQKFLDSYSVLPGSIRGEFDLSKFQEGMLSGNNIFAMFIKIDHKYLPILPRRFASILIDNWGDLYKTYGIHLKSNGMRYSMGILGKIQGYLKARVKESELFLLVNAVDSNGKHHEVIFAAALHARNKLLLIYVSDPVINSEQWQFHLNEFLPKLQESVKQISGPPIRMHLVLESKILEARNIEENDSVAVLPIIVIPQTKIVMETGIPDSMRHLVFSLEQFLGFIDEVKDIDEASDFLDFLFEYGDMLSLSCRVTPMDKLFDFRESNAVLVPGVRQPSLYIGNPHGASHIRYKSLSNFWDIFPIGAWGEPRGWRVNKVDNGRINLASRSLRLLALAAKAGNSSCLISFPLEDADFEQAQLCDFVGQIVQDTLERKSKIISKLRCLNSFQKIQVLIFPKSFLQREQFKHLRHMSSFDDIWVMDVGWPATNEPGVRIVFDEEKLQTAFESVSDASLEIDLLQQVLLSLNSLAPDENIKQTIEYLEKEKLSKPRFRINLEKQIVIAPRVISFFVPELADYKYARKRIASMAEKLGVPTGTFMAGDALSILNQLRQIAVNDINDHVRTLSYEKSLPLLIKQMEGIRQKEEFARRRSIMAKTHGVDYNIVSTRFEDHQEFIKHHRNLRYLIEKFVQLQPTGELVLTPDKYKYLIAQSDWLQSIYHASDAIHYDIEPSSISFDEDYIIGFDNTPDFERKTQSFGEHEEKLKLGLIGKDEDKIKGGRPGTDIVKDLNMAMSADFGFSYEEMVYVTTALAQWPHFSKADPAAVYSDSIEKIKKTINKSLPDIPTENVEKVLQFLTLKSDEMLMILEDANQADDLPIWEYSKRPARYNLRPILLCNGLLQWGPYSVWESMNLWAHSFLSGSSPVTLHTPKMKELISKRKKVFEDLLEEKAFEIVKRYTDHARINIELHKTFKHMGFPQEIGEFDALAYFPSQKTMISIEAKHIKEAYCAKDARRIREKIFGNNGYLGKTERRHKYLENNWKTICNALGWPINGMDEITIKTIYVAQRSYWWTMFPPVNCATEFTVLELLDDKLRNVLNL